MNYNDPDYRYYVINVDRDYIDGGFEFKDDAKDRAEELREETGEKAKVLMRAAAIKQYDLDPDDDDCWEPDEGFNAFNAEMLDKIRNPGPDVHIHRAREQLARARETKEPVRKAQRIGAAMQEAYWVMSDEGPYREEAAKIHREALKMRDAMTKRENPAKRKKTYIVEMTINSRVKPVRVEALDEESAKDAAAEKHPYAERIWNAYTLSEWRQIMKEHRAYTEKQRRGIFID